MNPEVMPLAGTGESFGRRLDHHFDEIEGEIRKVIAYLNDEVVPQIRRNSSTALRTASEQLGKLGEHLERHPTRSKE